MRFTSSYYQFFLEILLSEFHYSSLTSGRQFLLHCDFFHLSSSSCDILFPFLHLIFSLTDKMTTSAADFDLHDALEKTGCNDALDSLQECLGENDRSAVVQMHD